MRHAPLLLVLLALLAHGAGLASGFVYDDHRFIVDNAALADLGVQDALLDAARHTADRDRDVYRPLRVLGHALDRRRWGLDPFSLGAYASAEPGYTHLRRVLRQPVGNRIFFAGEACHRSLWSTAAGAHLSGLEVARNVNKTL